MYGFGEKGVRQCRNKALTDIIFCKGHSYLVKGDVRANDSGTMLNNNNSTRGNNGGEKDDDDDDRDDNKNKDDYDRRINSAKERAKSVFAKARRNGEFGHEQYKKKQTRDSEKQEVWFLNQIKMI